MRAFPSESFPKASRILKKEDYRKIFRLENRIRGKYLQIFYRIHPEGSFQARLGITIKKNYGKAPVRNRFKRLVREAFRTSTGALPKNIDINILPGYAFAHATMQEIREELLHMISSIYAK